MATSYWDPRAAGRPDRVSWDRHFLDLARVTASRATCSRRSHGALVVHRRRIVSTGYNGGPSGFAHCTEGACPRANSEAPSGHDYERCIAIHAEANALLFASPDEREGATLYTTGAPCFQCAKLISNSGISEVVAAGGRYDGWDEVQAFLRACGIRVRVLDGLDGLPVLDLGASEPAVQRTAV